MIVKMIGGATIIWSLQKQVTAGSIIKPPGRRKKPAIMNYPAASGGVLDPRLRNKILFIE